MAKKKITLEIEEYPGIEHLSEPDRRLLEEAKTALQLAYAPYSSFSVGVAVRTVGGAIVRGANLENAAYPMCLCGERSALAAAASQYPDEAVEAMAITVKHRHKTITEPAGPCGACRQVISETEDRFHHPVRIILQGETGGVVCVDSVKVLLPLHFTGAFL